jgi:hypothetical protein
MREEALRSVLLVKAIEEADRAGTLIPPADRAAATRAASRDPGARATAALERGGMPGAAQRMLAARAASLRERIVARYPFVRTVLGLARGPAWAGAVCLGIALLIGFALSALDGTRRINVLAFPLLGLLAWNLLVYVAVVVGWLRMPGKGGRAPALPALLARAGARRMRALVRRSAAFNAPLADALGRFVHDWFEAARPLLLARATRLFHLCAALVGVGLVAGLYLRGVALDYQAGWESTFLDAQQVQRVLSIAYGPASALTGIAVPDAAHLEAIRFRDGAGGERAARWIHLLAATVLLFIVLPRAALAALATLSVWRWALRAPLPPVLVPYFRTAFSGVEGVVGRGIAAVVPYAYEPAPQVAARLRALLPAALGEGVAVDLRAGVRYGEEDAFLANLADRGGGAIADALVLLLNLAATPEDENHGEVIAGVRDWLVRARPHTQLLVLLDEGPYRARMAAQGGAAARVEQRRETWLAFIADRGLPACCLDLSADAAEGATLEQLRAALWQPAQA